MGQGLIKPSQAALVQTTTRAPWAMATPIMPQLQLL